MKAYGDKRRNRNRQQDDIVLEGMWEDLIPYAGIELHEMLLIEIIPESLNTDQLEIIVF